MQAFVHCRDVAERLALQLGHLQQLSKSFLLGHHGSYRLEAYRCALCRRRNHIRFATENQSSSRQVNILGSIPLHVSLLEHTTLATILKEVKTNGIQNILARNDGMLCFGSTERSQMLLFRAFSPCRHGDVLTTDETRPEVTAQLIRNIRALHGDYFCIATVAYPEGCRHGASEEEVCRRISRTLPWSWIVRSCDLRLTCTALTLRLRSLHPRWKSPNEFAFGKLFFAQLHAAQFGGNSLL